MPQRPGDPGKFRVIQEIRGEVLAVRQVQDWNRVQIPKEVVESLDLRRGDKVYWVRDPAGQIVLCKASAIEGSVPG